MDPLGKNRRRFIGAVAGGATTTIPGLFSAGLVHAAATGRGTPVVAPHPHAGDAAGPTGVFDVTRFGAVGDGRTPATAGLQRALDACGSAGGGLVMVPPGTYATGALTLRSRTHLYLAPGSVLLASRRPEDYPPMKGRDEGVERMIHSALLSGVDLQDVSITGYGLIDGQGEPWWKADEAIRKLRVAAKLPREAENPEGAPLRWPRPRLINLIRCRNSRIEGITMKDGPAPNIHFVYCEGALVDGINVYQTRPARGTDGILVDSSKHVRITNCSLSGGSDCVGIKAGYNEEGRRIGLASEDIVISNCHMIHSSASGVAIGSETAGGINNVLVSDCVMQDCLSGVFIRAPRGRGGIVENLRITNIVMDRIEEQAFKISHFFDSIRMEGRFGFKPTFARSNVETVRGKRAPVDAGTPTFRDFDFSGIRISRARDVAVIEGLPERFIHGVTLDNFAVTQAKTGISCDMVTHLRISGFVVGALETPTVDVRDGDRLEIHRLRCGQPSANFPAVWLENVNGAFIHGCDIAAPAPGFAWLGQEQCKAIVLTGNNVPAPAPAAPTPGAPK
jgi:polygalacturonase